MNPEKVKGSKNRNLTASPIVIIKRTTAPPLSLCLSLIISLPLEISFQLYQPGTPCSPSVIRPYEGSPGNTENEEISLCPRKLMTWLGDSITKHLMQAGSLIREIEKACLAGLLQDEILFLLI